MIVLEVIKSISWIFSTFLKCSSHIKNIETYKKNYIEGFKPVFRLYISKHTFKSTKVMVDLKHELPINV